MSNFKDISSNLYQDKDTNISLLDLYDEDEINTNRDFIEEKIAVVILINGLAIFGYLFSLIAYIFIYNDPVSTYGLSR